MLPSHGARGAPRAPQPFISFEAYLDEDDAYLRDARTRGVLAHSCADTDASTVLEASAAFTDATAAHARAFDCVFDVPVDDSQLDLPPSSRVLLPVRAHRVVMAAASPVLHGLLFSGMSETTRARLPVYECSLRPFLALRRWIYTRAAPDVPMSDVIALRAAANYYLLSDLESHAQKVAYDVIHSGVAGAVGVMTQVAASTESIIAANSDLLELAFTRVCFAGPHALACPGFASIPIAALRAVLAADDLAAAEADVLDACIRWAKHALKARPTPSHVTTMTSLTASPVDLLPSGRRSFADEATPPGGLPPRPPSGPRRTSGSVLRTGGEDDTPLSHAERAGGRTSPAPGGSPPSPAFPTAVRSTSFSLALPLSPAVSPPPALSHSSRRSSAQPGPAGSMLTIAALDAATANVERCATGIDVHDDFRAVMRPLMPFIRWGRLSMDVIASAVMQHHILTQEELLHLIKPLPTPSRTPAAAAAAARSAPALSAARVVGAAPPSSYIRGVLEEIAERPLHHNTATSALAQLSAEATSASVTRKSSASSDAGGVPFHAAAAPAAAPAAAAVTPPHAKGAGNDIRGMVGALVARARGASLEEPVHVRKAPPPPLPAPAAARKALSQDAGGAFSTRKPPPKRTSVSNARPERGDSRSASELEHDMISPRDGARSTGGDVDDVADDEEEVVVLTARPRGVVKELRTSLEWHYNLRAAPMVEEDTVPPRRDHEALQLAGIGPRPARASGPPDGFRGARCGLWNDLEPDAEPRELRGVSILAAEWQFAVIAAAPGAAFFLGYCEQPGSDPTTVRKVGIFSSGEVVRRGLMSTDERDCPEHMVHVASIGQGDVVHFICRPATITVDAYVNGARAATFEQRQDVWMYPMLQVFGEDAYMRIALQFYRLNVRQDAGAE